MATLAVLLQDRQHIAIKGRWFRLGSVLRERSAHPKHKRRKHATENKEHAKFLSGMNRHVVTMRGLRRRWLASASPLFHAFHRWAEPPESPMDAPEKPLT
jgi:hypothetical protein